MLTDPGATLLRRWPLAIIGRAFGAQNQGAIVRAASFVPRTSSYKRAMSIRVAVNCNELRILQVGLLLFGGVTAIYEIISVSPVSWSIGQI